MRTTALLLAVSLAAPSLTRAQNPAASPAPTASPAAAQSPAAPVERGDQPAGRGAGVPGQRTRGEVGNDLAAATDELKALIPSEGTLHNAAKRDEIRARAGSVLKRLDALLVELVTPNYKTLSPDKVQLSKETCRLRYQPQLVAIGDADTIAMLNQQAKGADAEESHIARAILALGHAIGADDETGEVAAAREMASVLKDAPAQQAVDVAASNLIRVKPFSEPQRLQTVAVFKDFQGEFVTAAIRDTAATNAQKAFENKPIVLAGETINGKQFSTASLKGKVVLVDFWATWCGPCVAELPRVKKLYAQYHDKGFEVVGVSCDNKPDTLMSYLAAHPDMPWTQLFDVNKPGWHPLATQLGITGIPTMYLIDKNGVCRTVEARENMEDLIPKLLAEQSGM